MKPAAPEQRRNPWWIPRVFGRVTGIEPRLIRLLGFVAFAMLFENYDYSLLGAALKHIAEDLGIHETRLGTFGGLIRLGALPAFLVIPLADQLGRRRLFLAGVIGLSVGTFATAFSQTEAQFIACQVLSRSSMLVASALAFVIITEEFPAEHRGWGMGILAAVASVGHGLGAALFALIEQLPFGWRSLYAIGVMPVLLLPLFRSGVTETERFTRQDTGSGQRTLRSGLRDWFQPMAMLAREHPARGAGIIAIGALSSFGQAVVFAFIGYFVLTVHGWLPWQYAVMVIACGALGTFGNVAGGRLADRYGRRAVGFAVFAVFPLFSWLFFRGPGWSLPFSWILLVFSALASGVISRAFSTELFPTAQRGTAAGIMVLAETLGASAGLLALSLVTREPGDLVQMLPIVASVTLLAAFIVLLFPETSRRELEAINFEDLGDTKDAAA